MVYFFMLITIFFDVSEGFPTIPNNFFPGFIQYFIYGINVVSSGLSTAIIKRISRVLFNSTENPLSLNSVSSLVLSFANFTLINLHRFPGPPSGTTSSYTINSQISRQNMSKSTAVLDPNCNCILIFLCFKLWPLQIWLSFKLWHQLEWSSPFFFYTVYIEPIIPLLLYRCNLVLNLGLLMLRVS